MARTLGPVGRGAASAVQLWPVIVAGVVTFGIPVALRYNVRRKLDIPDELFSVAVTLSFLSGALAGVAGYFAVPLWLSQYSPDVVRFGQAMMVFTPLMTVNALLQAFLESRGDFTKSSGMLYIPPLGTLATLGLLWLFHDITVFTVPLAYEMPFSFITLLTLYRLRRNIRIPKEFLRRTKALLDFGLRAYGLDILNTLSAQIGQAVVVGVLSAYSFGLYSVALSVSRVLAIVSSSLNMVLFPKASELDAAAAIRLVSRGARLLFAINVVGGLSFIALMPPLIRLAYGKAYLPMVHVAQVLTIEVIFSATITTLVQAFMATGRPGLVTMLQAAGLCTTFPLMLVLIPRFGLIGAAYALLISTLFRLALVFVSFPIFLKHAPPSLLAKPSDFLDLRGRLQRKLG